MNYAARISLDRTQMRIEDKLVNLTTRNGSDGPARVGSSAIRSSGMAKKVYASDKSESCCTTASLRTRELKTGKLKVAWGQQEFARNTDTSVSLGSARAISNFVATALTGQQIDGTVIPVLPTFRQ